VLYKVLISFIVYQALHLVFVDQRVSGVAAGNSLDTTGEPQSDFTFSRLNRVGTVTAVSSNIKSIVTTDGTGSTGQGVGLTQHLATSLNGVLTGKNHTNNRSGGHVFDQRGEETLTLQILVLYFAI
jgi:hypothetical protein